MTVASEINDQMALVREFAPNLVCLRAALVPFNDVIVEEFAGPQPQAEDYDPDEEPYFSVGVRCGQHSNTTVVFRFTADRITMQEWITVKKGKKHEEWPGDDEADISLAGVFNYIRQLPRPVTSFA